jgi:hypothetical protein
MVNAVYGNNRGLLWESYNTDTLCGSNTELLIIEACDTYSYH